MLYERIQLDTTDGAQVALDVYCPHVSNEIDPDPHRRSVLICPGGGYEFKSEREAEPIALSFASAGFNAFVLWYRVAPDRFPRPQQDAAAAMAYIRRNAVRFHTDPDKLAILGFSAGGHLACSIGVMWQDAALWASMDIKPEEVRPSAMVLCYPVISGGSKAHRGSFVNLTGTTDTAVHEQYSLDARVTDATPPTFLWTTWDDEVVPSENTLLMATALRKAGVQAEVHIYPHGPHGSSRCDEPSSGIVGPKMMLPDCVGWLAMAQRFLKNEM